MTRLYVIIGGTTQSYPTNLLNNIVDDENKAGALHINLLDSKRGIYFQPAGKVHSFPIIEKSKFNENIIKEWCNSIKDNEKKKAAINLVNYCKEKNKSLPEFKTIRGYSKKTYMEYSCFSAGLISLFSELYNTNNRQKKNNIDISFVSHSRGCALIAGLLILNRIKLDEFLRISGITYLDPVNKNQGWETSELIIQDTKMLIYDQKRNYPVMFVLKGKSSMFNYQSYVPDIFNAEKGRNFNQRRNLVWTRNTFVSVSNTAHEHMLDQTILDNLGEQRDLILFYSKYFNKNNMFIRKPPLIQNFSQEFSHQIDSYIEDKKTISHTEIWKSLKLIECEDRRRAVCEYIACKVQSDKGSEKIGSDI